MKWMIFVRERFDPVSHFLLIALFFLTHLLVAGSVSFLQSLSIFVGTIAFFFKLRLYDEIKDYEVDLEFNPTRPLARGLLKHQDFYRGIVLCIVIELGTFGSHGLNALLGIALAIAYSLLMYREFFIGPLLRKYLTTYAVTHTVVSAFLSLAIFAALTGLSVGSLGREYFFFALNSWCLFNVFEFGRKTFVSVEERPRVASYSGIFGRYGAAILVGIMVLVSDVLLWELWTPHVIELRIYLSTLGGVLVSLGLISAFYNRNPFGKTYRMASSVYILFVYVGVSAAMYF